MMILEIAYIVLGIILLMFGRRLFFIFAGMSAFLIGFEYSRLLFHVRSEKAVLIISLICAIVGIILAFVFKKIGLSIAGFLAGGYISMMLVRELGFRIGWWPWVIFVLGGVLGIILIAVIFEWALIILSSLVGSFLIIQITGFNVYWTKVLFVILTAVGIAAQLIQYRTKE
jgi:hypothetical protein